MDKNLLQQHEQEQQKMRETFPMYKFKKLSTQEKKHLKVTYQGKQIPAWKYLDAVWSRIKVIQLSYKNFMASTGITADITKVTEQQLKAAWNENAIEGVGEILTKVRTSGKVLADMYDAALKEAEEAKTKKEPKPRKPRAKKQQ